MTEQRTMLATFTPLVLALSSVCSVAQVVPTKFVHDRVFVVAPAPDGSTLNLFTDTGGGWNAISKSAAERLKLRAAGEVDGERGKAHIVNYPEFLRRAGVPAPSKEPWLNGHLVVAPDAELTEGDGTLGSRWFADRVWRIDYPGQTLEVISGWKPSGADHVAALGFASRADGKRALNFPRIAISVDGKPIDVLLDTGATAELTEESAPAFQVKPGTKTGTSYVIKTIFDRWHAAHPTWRVLEKAEKVTGHVFAMIEVPEVTVAGVTIGPVWFTQRPDATFQKWMSQMMDREISGAIGGSTLKYLRIVLDYPGATAYVLRN
ncbi:MAG: hypothetical protein ABI769_10635 [Pseudomonadota bacterium]